jgi:hypothetical protein
MTKPNKPVNNSPLRLRLLNTTDSTSSVASIKRTQPTVEIEPIVKLKGIYQWNQISERRALLKSYNSKIVIPKCIS